MIKKNVKLSFAVILLLAVVSFAQDYFPDIDGYHTLVSDFHTHTVFSDGDVWPSVRIKEAKREHLDVIAITDHIEYQPHYEDLPTKHDRPYEIAKNELKDNDKLILIKGTEITRDTPPGHYNAVFIKDISSLAKHCAKDEETVEQKVAKLVNIVGQANNQGAFVFWNHHDWKGQDRGNWMECHTKMVADKQLHGMEVVNGGSYYPRAHQWCIDNNLTMLGNSDIHRPSINYKYTPEKHRSLTLVFAKERTADSVREALDAARTAVWYKNSLIGDKELLGSLLDKLLVFTVTAKGDDFLNLMVENTALIDLEVAGLGQLEGRTSIIPARSEMEVNLPLFSENGKYTLEFSVSNFKTAPNEGLHVIKTFE